MKVIVAGGRDITDAALVARAIAESGFAITEVVSGCQRGVDAIGEQWAMAHRIPIKPFHADWDRHGKAAGPLRNQAMAEYADALVAVWDGRSRGTGDMIRRARQLRLKVYVAPATPQRVSTVLAQAVPN